MAIQQKNEVGRIRYYARKPISVQDAGQSENALQRLKEF